MIVMMMVMVLFVFSQLDDCTAKVTSTTLEIHTTGVSIKDDAGNDDDDDQANVTSLIAPAEPGTPVTLSGVIWKETMGGKFGNELNVSLKNS